MMDPPRWKTVIESALSNHKFATVIQIATCSLTTPPTPHVRSHIFRSFLSPSNLPELNLIVTSTDIRTSKISQITSNPHVEVVWWISGTQEQFRITGRAFILPSPNHPLHKADFGKGEGDVLDAISKENFDWEAKRKETFDAMTPRMKVSWCRPTPGTPLSSHPPPSSLPEELPRLEGAKTDEEKRLLEEALENFALVVIEPDGVDFVELGVYPNRRTRFEWKGRGKGWVEEAVVP